MEKTLDGLVIPPLIKIVKEFAKPIIVINESNVWMHNATNPIGGNGMCGFAMGVAPYLGIKTPSLMGWNPQYGFVTTYYGIEHPNFPIGRLTFDLSTFRARLDSLGLKLVAECTIEIQLDKITILTQNHSFTFPATWKPQTQ